ncbi:Microsomal glutathione S-transferase-like protein [Hapsidospora chrysogenum ATCC 11550]|uniref:Microsomal glutathione S-transferase-like protein n=1 Tax=Hapsidospora chrysogenum (strain ATCC 11550 / CBS 779.69 / DSM 880 / IAM 14645 / JCM 23072 / IMI 49137) TaxID=857340 RepID=A0A086T1P5_HAPC1|nr:Microsomal glutathione S-transferase-like protein [Hapsidospora chrysogenum ATCC 11550]
MPIQIPDEYGYVLAVASSGFFVNMFHMQLTGMHRKKSGLKHPISYATEEQAAKDNNAFRFNCAQRAHANFIENQPTFLSLLAVSGLRYPVAAAALGATWMFGRVAYGMGYASSRGPQGRVFGFLVAMLAQMVLGGMAGYTSYKYIVG